MLNLNLKAMKTKILLAVLASVFFLAACENDYLTEDIELAPIEKSAVVGEGTLVSEMMHVKAFEGNLLGVITSYSIHYTKLYDLHPLLPIFR